MTLIHQARSVPDAAAALEGLEALFQGNVFANTVVEGDLDVPLGLQPAKSELARESVKILDYTPNRILVEASCAAPGLLLYSENYYPGWQATVDGVPATVLPANVFMRAVPVQAGKHTVEMNYRPVPFRNGCVIAAVSFGIVVAGFGYSLFRKRPAA